MEELCHRFGESSRKDFIEEFTKLSQIGTVFDYQEQFEHLRSLMDTENSTLSKRFFISSFISSLRPQLQPMLRFLKPQTLNQAFEQTLLQEQYVIELSRISYPIKVAKVAEVYETRNYDHPLQRDTKPRRATATCYKCGDRYFPG